MKKKIVIHFLVWALTSLAIFSQCKAIKKFDSLSLVSYGPLNNLAKINTDVNNNIRKIGNSLLTKEADHDDIQMEIKYKK